MNSMRRISVDKVTLNIGVGEPGTKLDNAMQLLETLTGAKPVAVKTMRRIPSWGVRPKLKIAAKVTLRGKDAVELLKRLLEAKEGKMPRKKFDQFGNFSFGIAEYIDIPGLKYDVKIGIIGLEAAVTLCRPGFRVKRRANANRIPLRHRISRDEAMTFMQENFGLAIVDAREVEA